MKAILLFVILLLLQSCCDESDVAILTTLKNENPSQVYYFSFSNQEIIEESVNSDEELSIGRFTYEKCDGDIKESFRNDHIFLVDSVILVDSARMKKIKHVNPGLDSSDFNAKEGIHFWNYDYWSQTEEDGDFFYVITRSQFDEYGVDF